jgi:hypothetical protein
MAIDTIKSSAVLDGAIATADIADNAVTTAKIANAQVSLAKLAADVSFDESTINSGNTSARAATPTAGTLYYNTDIDSVQIYNTEWNDIFTVPTLSAATGNLLVGNASTLTLTVVTPESTIDVEFRSGSTILATVTGVAVSSGSASVTVPSSVYNNITAGQSYTVRAKGEKGTRSLATQSLTATSVASGGTITIVGGYAFHEFLSSSTFTVPSGLSITNAEVVIVGGGGSGGTGSSGLGANNNGAAGGGGGVQHLTSQTLSVGSHSIVIGSGGSGVAPSNNAGNDGNSSSAFSSTAGGGNNNSGLAGGASGTPQSTGGGAGGSYSGGGGGGAGGVGTGGGSNVKKAGGAGILKSNFTSWGAAAQASGSITATPTANGYFAGGGQGAGAGGSSSRASGGGGAAGNNTAVNSLNAGVPNTGGGGAGGYAQTEYSGNGGSGIVLIRYQV